MKYLAILSFVLAMSCQRDNPKCLNGYLVYSKKDFMGFCLAARQSTDGIYGFRCWDGPRQGSRVEANLTLREGFVMKTSCYNILSREKE